jgi:hypothetical protein
VPKTPVAAPPRNQASAHQRITQTAQTIMNPNDVWVGNDFAGRGPDPNVRLELRRTFGQSE